MSLVTLLVVDPGGLGILGRQAWARLAPEALRRLAPAESVEVRGAGEAGQAAWEAAIAGTRRVIAVGNDATVHGVVNGLMRLAEGHRREMRFGILTLARQRSALARSLDWPLPAERQLDLLAAAHMLPWDVGRVECAGPDGTGARYFLSGAAFGLPGGVGLGALANAGLDLLMPGGRLAIRGILDGAVAFQGPCSFGVALVGSHHPLLGGLAPQANPLDGALDVGWLPTAGARQRVLALAGALLGRSWGLTWRTALQVRIEGGPGAMTVTADGIAVGKLPATFTSLPRALPVIVESVGSRLRRKEEALLRKQAGASLAGEAKRTAGS